jgi:hypothetical protein
MPQPVRQLRIGTLGVLQRAAFIPYDRLRPCLVTHIAETLPLAADLCEGIALQLLGQHSVGQARLSLFEATASPYFPQLKRLFAISDQRWGEQLFTTKDCLKRLTELEELTHRRFALLAQAGAADIHAYNTKAARAEPVIYLLISGLGAALSESEPLQQLQTLCGQGPAVGIIPLLLRNTTEETESHIPDLRRKNLQVFWQRIYVKASGLDVCDKPKPLQLPPELWQLLQRFDLQLTLGQTVCKTWADALLASSQQTEAEEANTDFLHIRVGLSGATPAYFSMGEKSDAYHALIGGATRTGKTTLINNLILNACEVYTPDKLQLTLLDFKDGISFWEYEGLGHVANLYAPSEDNFAEALRCLESFEQQIRARNDLFRAERKVRLAEYNQVAKQPLPRCLLVVDEAQNLFEGRNFQQKAAVKRILSSVAKKGAAAGVHIILSTQSFQNVELEGDVKDQFHLRIGLRHASGMGCRALMGRDNDAMLNLPRFAAIYNRHQGEAQHNRVVNLDDLPDFDQRLDALKAQFPRVVHEAGLLNSIPLESQTEVVSLDDGFASGDVSEPW